MRISHEIDSFITWHFVTVKDNNIRKLFGMCRFGVRCAIVGQNTAQVLIQSSSPIGYIFAIFREKKAFEMILSYKMTRISLHVVTFFYGLINCYDEDFKRNRPCEMVIFLMINWKLFLYQNDIGYGTNNGTKRIVHRVGLRFHRGINTYSIARID